VTPAVTVPLLRHLLPAVLIGFSIAAPVGPIGVLCIRRTLLQGRAHGLFSGLGAATADAVYGAVAAFGLSFIAQLLVDNQVWLRLVGGAVLCYLGTRTFLTHPHDLATAADTPSLVSAFFTTFLLTLTNPLTILSFGAVFAGLGLGERSGLQGASLVTVVGVFVGSVTWWFLLSLGVGLARGWVTPSVLRWVNRVSGVVVAGFGLVALVGAIVGGG